MEKKSKKNKKKKKKRSDLHEKSRDDGEIVGRTKKKKKKKKNKEKSPIGKLKTRKDILAEDNLLPEEPNRITLLSQTDKALIRNILQFGDIAFEDLGYTPEDKKNFLSRPEVREYLESMEDIVHDRASQQERVRAFTLMDLSRMARRAVKVLHEAMLGAHEDDDGQIATPPHPMQVEAAKEVLRILGIDGKSVGSIPITKSNVILFANEDDYPVDSPLRREKVRRAVDQVLSKIKNQVEAETGEEFDLLLPMESKKNDTKEED